MTTRIKRCLLRFIPYEFYPSIFTAQKLVEYTDRHVNSGPFMHMKYVAASVGSEYLAKLLGTYELELHTVIETLCTKPLKSVINVGAGEGYYAIGFAVRIRDVQVIAFEQVEKGRKLIVEMAELNGVSDRIDVRSRCGISDLNTCLSTSDKTQLVIMDTEGAEQKLLNPDQVPGLKDAYIVVELHDYLIPRLGELIEERFRGTHKILEIWTSERNLSNLPMPVPTIIALLMKPYLLKTMDEHRDGQRMRWFYLEPYRAN